MFFENFLEYFEKANLLQKITNASGLMTYVIKLNVSDNIVMYHISPFHSGYTRVDKLTIQQAPMLSVNQQIQYGYEFSTEDSSTTYYNDFDCIRQSTIIFENTDKEKVFNIRDLKNHPMVLKTVGISSHIKNTLVLNANPLIEQTTIIHEFNTNDILIALDCHEEICLIDKIEIDYQFSDVGAEPSKILITGKNQDGNFIKMNLYDWGFFNSCIRSVLETRIF